MTRDEHLDEGTIHAWLDGALDPAAASAVAAHVESCTSCAERVAEARGLIAGASRVVGALDEAPAAPSPAWGSGSAAAGRAPGTPSSAWRRMRLTPARAAIAATLLVAAGVTLTYQRTGPDTVMLSRERAEGTSMSSVASSGAGATAAAARPHDALLDSAVKRNIAAAQPPRTVEAAPAPAVPQPPALRPTLTARDTIAGARVAVGRTAAQALRDSSSGVADRARAGVPAAAPSLEARVAGLAAKAADSAANSPRAAALPRPLVQTATSVPVPAECYRVESASGTPAVWGSVETPFIVALGASGNGVRVLTADGVDTETRATWTRGGADSVLLRLRRIGFQGTLALGAPGDVRAGVMRSAPISVAPGQVVTTAAGTVNAAPAVPVVARRTVCPSR